MNNNIYILIIHNPYILFIATFLTVHDKNYKNIIKEWLTILASELWVTAFDKGNFIVPNVI